jgi:hypothetical protein
MSILGLHHDLMSATADIEKASKLAITKLQEARKLNDQMQKAAVGTPEWHMHETIDDRLHDALTALGD